MPKKTKAKVPDWVDTENGQQKKPPVGASLRESISGSPPESWYGSSYPIIIATKEWSIDRSKSMMPSRKKKALIRIEIRRKADQPLGMHGYRDPEDGSVISDWGDIIRDGDIIVFNVLKQKNEGAKKLLSKASSISRELSLKRESSSGSLSTLGVKGVDGGVNMTAALTEEWIVVLSTAISKTAIKRHGSHCTISLETMNSKASESFTAHFDTDDNAMSFVAFVKKIKSTHSDVAQRTIIHTIDSKSITSSTNSIDYLIEIISAADLKPTRIRRIKRSPYVIVRYEGKKIVSSVSCVLL